MATVDRLARLAAAARATAKTHADDREARDTEIEAADRDGMGLREIARATGLSPGQVQRIVAQRTARRQAR